MTYNARTRDGYRHALSVLTGLTTVGVLTACGWLAGAASEDFHAEQAAKETARKEADHAAQADWRRQQAAWHAAQPRQVRTVWKRHPVKTVVDTRTVMATSTTIGAGGPVSSGSSTASSTASRSTGSSGSSGSSGSVSSGSGTGSSGSGPRPSAPKPPPPPPAPAPSSGS